MAGGKLTETKSMVGRHSLMETFFTLGVAMSELQGIRESASRLGRVASRARAGLQYRSYKKEKTISRKCPVLYKS